MVFCGLRVLTGVGCGRRVGLAVVYGGGYSMGGAHGGLGCVEVGLLLELSDILLVADPLVAKPVGYLRKGKE